MQRDAGYGSCEDHQEAAQGQQVDGLPPSGWVHFREHPSPGLVPLCLFRWCGVQGDEACAPEVECHRFGFGAGCGGNDTDVSGCDDTEEGGDPRQHVPRGGLFVLARRDFSGHPVSVGAALWFRVVVR